MEPLSTFREDNMIQRFIPSISAKVSLALALLGIAGSSAVAAEIRLLSAVALKPVMDTLIPDFEKSSGHTVTIAYGTVGALTERVQKGEPVDVTIVAGPQIDNLQTQGKVAVGSRANIAKVGVGAVVRKGAAKPDISDVEAFKRTMLAARSILYPDPAGGGPPGIWMSGLLDRLGIGAEMKQKTKLANPGPNFYDSVASGDAEIGFNQISENLAASNVDPIGPLPPAIQNYTQFAAGIGASSTQMDAAKALITFLTSPSSVALLKTRGYE
jgi:molybdate transport system substrate-binding protein